MLIIAENINSSRKKIKPILENKDTAALKELVGKLDATDCDYIDINAGVYVNQETELMLWLAEEVQKLTDKPLSIDSPNIDVIKAVITQCEKKAFLNSITIEKDRYEKTIPVVLEHKPNVIALSIDDEGIPETIERRVEVATKLAERLIADGVPAGDIYLDPIIMPIGANHESGQAVIATLGIIKEKFPDINFICGLSNISHGMPIRKVLNRSCLLTLMPFGMNGAILDPLDSTLMSLIRGSEAILGQDEWCADYIGAHRAGKIIA